MLVSLPFPLSPFSRLPVNFCGYAHIWGFLCFGVGIFISFFIGFWLPFAELGIYMTWYMMMHRILGLLFFSKVDANRLCFQNLSLVFRITVFFWGKRYIFVGVRLRPFFLEFSLICSWYHRMFSFWAETSAPLKILPGYFGVSYSSFSWRGKQILEQGSRPVMMIVSALPAFLKCLLYCECIAEFGNFSYDLFS